ncbi:sensor histidine kinase [Vibrio gallicus]|uniref:sensor histidine kinase n=1 Tax=Vibrio gallicus TaxID=190897 RepID=UPI0021C3F632|nr:HAMP domain-containing sensor histidine kinase [Vibrio gallicus]
MSLKIITKWRRRFQTMVRYRLMFLTSAPIILTLIALVAITAYWSVHYTWQNALYDVSERLYQANTTLEHKQQIQQLRVQGLADSKAIQNMVSQHHLSSWLDQQSISLGVDLLRFEHNSNLKGIGTFLEVLPAEQLTKSLALESAVPLLGSDKVESQVLALVSRVQVLDDAYKVIGVLVAIKVINNDDALVDQLREQIYPRIEGLPAVPGTVTIFLGDLRISSNVPANEYPAIGSYVSQKVKQHVLINGEVWSNLASVNDTWYISAYMPLINASGNKIGMLYTGYRMKPFLAAYLSNIVDIILVTLAVLLLSGVAVYRGARDLFTPFERIHRVVRLVQFGKPTRIGDLGLNENHELTQLARQFDSMLDSLDASHSDLQRAANELEDKVASRTQSLHERSHQLQLHIELLNKTRDRLVVSEKLAALGELTAGIAHEINNPVAVILGNIELIKLELSMSDGGDIDVDDEVSTIIAQIDRIRNITYSLLQYSRHGGIQDQVTWQYVNPIVEESLVLVKTGNNKKGVQYITDLKARASVEINRNQLLQVLVNLQMNAAHAMDNKGTLTITSEEWIENGAVLGAKISIADQGCGIAAKHLSRIFDPFYTTKKQGTGLGLSLSQSLLHQIGGELLVESELGVGSTFTIVLPHRAPTQLQVANL